MRYHGARSRFRYVPKLRTRTHTQTHTAWSAPEPANLELGLIKLLICRTNEGRNKNEGVVWLLYFIRNSCVLFPAAGNYITIKARRGPSFLPTPPPLPHPHQLSKPETFSHCIPPRWGKKNNPCFCYRLQISRRNAWVTHWGGCNEKLCCGTTQQLNRDARFFFTITSRWI